MNSLIGVNMKVFSMRTMEIITDVICDLCEKNTNDSSNQAPNYGVLSARWGYASKHDGEKYEVHLCETCFFTLLASAKEIRRSNLMFSETEEPFVDNLGLINE